MIDLTLTIATITLTENGLNTPIKRHRSPNLIKKKKAWPICHLQETQFKYKETNTSKVKGWKKISHSNAN